jgi:hypothetical protein
MTQFPNSPSVGDQVTFSNATYEWDGSRWKSLGTIAVGPTGATGSQGIQGVTGNTGAAGSAGSQGIQGVTGNTGAAGSAGSQGIQGVTGNTGAQGDQGIQGTTGNTGSAGTSVGYTAGNTAPSGSATGDFWYENDTALYYANVFDGSTLGWLQISGIDGTNGVTGNTGAAGSASGVSAGAGLTLNGVTLGIDSTAIVHVAGISSDGGATFGGIINVDGGNPLQVDVSVAGVVSANKFFDPNNQRNGLALGTLNNVEMVAGNQTVVLYQSSLITFNKLLKTVKGISMDAEGITFPDGTHQTTAASASTVTASYHGHLESAITKTYYVDPRVPTARTVTEFYAICATGGCSAGIAGQNGSISTINVSTTGVTGSLANTALPVGGTLDMTLSNVSGCFDFRFAVRYTQ